MRTNVALPKVGTKSSKDFFNSWKDINSLFDFILHLAGSAEHTAKIAHDALVECEENEVKKAAMVEKWKRRKSPIDELKKNRQVLLETILVRHVENFINYVASVLFEIFTSRPETLKSSEKIEVSKVLEHDSIESLVREIAESKVDSLSYSSFSKLSEFFQDRFKITIASNADIELLHRYIEIRNISVHSRCYISKRFVARLGLDPSEIGKKKELFLKDVEMLIPKLAEIAKFMDSTVRRKMKVRGVRFNE